MTHVPNPESCDANSAKASAPKKVDRPLDARLLSVMEATAYLNISRALLYQLLKRAEFARIKIGRRTLFERHDLDAFVVRHRATSTV